MKSAKNGERQNENQEEIDYMQRKLIALLLLGAVVSVAFILMSRKTTRIVDGGHVLPADTVTQKRLRPVVRIYLENSGSMDGFVTTNSEFKTALGHLITKADGYYPNTRLQFINQGIYDSPICHDLNNFMLNLNPQSMKVGQTGSTDINSIYRMILDHTQNDTVSILVSDCVYDVDNVGNLLSAAASSTTGTFMKAIRRAQDRRKEFGVIIMQCLSRFAGRWYGVANSFVIDDVRPYYIICMGRRDLLADINEHLELLNTKTGIVGLTHKLMFSSEPTWQLNEQTARTFTTGFTNALRIQPEHDGLNIRRFTTDQEQNNLTFAVGLGVSKLFCSNAYLLDKESYEVEPKGYKVVGVTDEAQFTEADYFLHPFCVQIQTPGKNFSSEITLRLKNIIPSWVQECSYTKNYDGLPPKHKSYALYEMVEGIYNAFYNAREATNKDIFKLKLRVGGYD